MNASQTARVLRAGQHELREQLGARGPHEHPLFRLVDALGAMAGECDRIDDEARQAEVQYRARTGWRPEAERAGRV
jgi:hypothetical protein